MSKKEERISILLYNAVSLLMDKLTDKDTFVDSMWEICDKLGTTPTELKKLGVDFDEMF